MAILEDSKYNILITMGVVTDEIILKLVLPILRVSGAQLIKINPTSVESKAPAVCTIIDEPL